MPGAFNADLIPKCHDRLNKSKQALQDCRSAHEFSDFASHWASFLIHTGSILNALDRGSNSTPQGRQWYGGVKRAGRADPLISYMHQARNVEEHGAEPTSENSPTSLSIGHGGEAVYIESMTIGPELFRNPKAYLKGRVWNPDTGEMPSIIHHAGGPALKPVKDERFGNIFNPPTEHEGKPLSDLSPVGVAEAYLRSLERTIAQAAAIS